MSAFPMNNPKLISAWCMYDWANSAFTLTIGAAVFPAYWGSTAKGMDGSNVIDFFGFPVENSVLYSYTLSFAFLLMCFSTPLLSGVADASKRKLDFMKFFTYLGGLSCLGLFFFTQETTQFAVIFFGLGYIAFGSSTVFYNSFLPDLVTDDRIDKVSARGFSLGYIGSVILLIVNLAMIIFSDAIGIDKGLASRISFASVGIWWVAFAQITFNALKTKNQNKVVWNKEVLLAGVLELKDVAKKINQLPTLKAFLPAFFFFNMGIQTIMLIAALFGENELHLETQQLITVILLIQLLAVVGARITSWLSSKLGNKLVLIILVIVWNIICGLAWGITTAEQFYMLAALVGLIMGGSQSLSRSTYAKLIPDGRDDTASFFSFYDVAEKISIVIGTATFGIVDALTGSMRTSILGLITFFAIGLVLLVLMPNSKELKPVISTAK